MIGEAEQASRRTHGIAAVEGKRFGDAVFVGLVAMIALLPLPLASDRPLAWDVMALWTALLLVAGAFLPARALSEMLGDLLVPGVLFVVVLGFAAVQFSPLTPVAWHNPIWDQAAAALNGDFRGAIAADRQAAMAGLLRLASYGGIFYLAVVLCRDAGRARAAVTVVAAAGCAYAAYGLVVYSFGNHTVLWLPKRAYSDDLTGPFINRNSFATYLGLCILAVLCRFVASAERLPVYSAARDRLRVFIEFLSARSWLLAAVFLLATDLLLTHSRAGAAATVLGVIVLALAIAAAPSLRWSRYLRWSAIPIVLAAAAFLISGGATVARLADSDIAADSRLAVYQITAGAIRDYPFLGTGLGSFATVFPLYQTQAVTSYYDLAHNDYLQTVLELGIPAAACLFAAILWTLGLCVRGIRQRQRNAIFPCLGLAASALVMSHASVDFSLQMPAVAATYVFLLGAAVAQSRSSRPGRAAGDVSGSRGAPSQMPSAARGPRQAP